MLGDRQPQPGAPRFPRASFVHAVETLEQAWQVLKGNARAEIAHIEFNAAFRTPRPQNQPSTRRSVLKRIVDEVGKNLVDGLAIGTDQVRRRVFHLQVDTVSTRQFAEVLDCLLQNLCRGYGLNVKSLLA